MIGKPDEHLWDVTEPRVPAPVLSPEPDPEPMPAAPLAPAAPASPSPSPETPMTAMRIDSALLDELRFSAAALLMRIQDAERATSELRDYHDRLSAILKRLTEEAQHLEAFAAPPSPAEVAKPLESAAVRAGRRVADMRKRRGLTQKELIEAGAQLGITWTARQQSDLERGTYDLLGEQWDALAATLGIEAWRLKHGPLTGLEAEDGADQ